ncbi:hypothetical protein [Nocardia sp. NPDC004722]
MTDKVEVDPELLRNASAKTNLVNDRLRAVLTGLEAASDGRSGAWGNDEYGQKFAKGESGNGYLAARDNLTAVVGKLAGNTDGQSTGQQDSSKLHDGTDKSNADAFKV